MLKYTCHSNINVLKTFLDPPDYLAVDTTITILSGTKSGSYFCISVNVIDDELLETNESFYLTLQSLSPNVVAVVDDRDVQHVIIVDNEREYNICLL